jgi:hypothetical protein
MDGARNFGMWNLRSYVEGSEIRMYAGGKTVVTSAPFDCSSDLHIYGPTVICWTLAAFSVSESYTQSVGLLGLGTSPLQGRYLHPE